MEQYVRARPDSGLRLDGLITTLLTRNLGRDPSDPIPDSVLGPDRRPGTTVTHRTTVSRVQGLPLTLVDLLLLLAIDDAVVVGVRVLHRSVGHTLQSVVDVKLVLVLPARGALHQTQVVVVETRIDANLDAQLADDLELVRLVRLLVDVVALERAEVVSGENVELEINDVSICDVAQRRDRDSVGFAAERSQRQSTTTQVEREQRAVSVVHGQADERLGIFGNGLTRVDLLRVVAGGYLDLLGLELLVSLDLDLGEQLNRGSVPTEHVLRQLSLDAAEDETAVHLAESDTVLERERLRHLRRLAQHLRQVQRNDAHDRVVLAKSSVANGETHLGASPVANKHLSAGLVERHVGVLLDTRLVDDIVVDDEFDVAAGKSLAFTGLGIDVLTGGAFSLLAHDTLLDFSVLEARNVVDDDAQDT
ncbi:hypothetical protein PHBOTO_003501 [Pseudozyma hubeiensis]|nr:hypothetical protein PHBOTO_003501 [Pseudozyma hubeiensis]